MQTTGYVFNDGELVYIADYREIEEEAFSHIRQSVKLMVVPLTTVEGGRYHAGFAEIKIRRTVAFQGWIVEINL